MNLVSSARIRYEDLRSIAFGSITGTYASIGSSFENPVRLIKVTNQTDVNCLISFNGIDDHYIAPAQAGYIYDYGTNKYDQCGYAEQSAGDRIYVKAEGALPTQGSVYVTVIYLAQR